MADLENIKISEEAKMWMADLADSLRRFYRRIGRHLTEKEFLLELERLYGNDILRKVGIPHGLPGGVCLLIAAQVAREDARAVGF